MLEERFLCYIRGGQSAGLGKTHTGCADKSLPLKKQKLIINRELYFAKQSTSWNKGGVCFLKTNAEKDASTLGRMYLITKEQFVDIIRQENDIEENLQIDLDKVIFDGSLVFKKDAWYGNIIYLGAEKEIPIFTFTNEFDILQANRPDKKYLRTIVKGIQETYNLGKTEILEYFISKAGIKGNYTRDELITIINDANQ
jgi:hypothetical protein